jgi:hypothetical protein
MLVVLLVLPLWCRCRHLLLLLCGQRLRTCLLLLLLLLLPVVLRVDCSTMVH